MMLDQDVIIALAAVAVSAMIMIVLLEIIKNMKSCKPREEEDDTIKTSDDNGSKTKCYEQKDKNKNLELVTSYHAKRVVIQDLHHRSSSGSKNKNGGSHSSYQPCSSEHYRAIIQDLHCLGYSEVARAVALANPNGKCDPVSMLNDDLCCEIFSYLCEKPKTKPFCGKEMTTIIWLRTVAGPLCFRLSSVSQKWKSVCDKNFPWSDWIGLVNLDVEGNKSIHSDSARSLVRWLIRHKIRLGALHFQESISLEETKDMELLTNLFENCPTDDLWLLKCFTQQKGDHCYFSPDNNQGHRLKKLHDLIAQKCPNLKFVTLSLMLPKTTPIYSDYISKSLFSISSIETLDLWVGYYGEKQKEVDPELAWGTKTPIDSKIFTKLIRALPNLVELEIYGSCASAFRDERGRKIRFHVASPTLKRLLCTDRGPVLSVDCPALERFVCNGGTESNNCILSRITPQQFLSQQARYMAKDFPPSPHLQVPRECKLTVRKLSKWNFVNYGKFRDEVKANVTNAVYQTFDDCGEANIDHLPV